MGRYNQIATDLILRDGEMKNLSQLFILSFLMISFTSCLNDNSVIKEDLSTLDSAAKGGLPNSDNGKGKKPSEPIICQEGDVQSISCSLANATEAKQSQVCQNNTWVDSGSCIAISCASGYELQNNSCVQVSAFTAISINAIDIGENQVTIDFKLSDYAQAQVEYGLSTTYGSFSTKEQSFNYKDHLQVLSNLQSGSTYHYRVLATAQDGRQFVSGDYTFKTLAAPVLSCSGEAYVSCNLANATEAREDRTCDTTTGMWVLSGNCYAVSCASGYELQNNSCVQVSTFTATSISAVNIGESQASIDIRMSDFSQAQVEYGLSTAYGSFSTKEQSFNYKDHLQLLSNLQSGTTYHYRVLATAQDGSQFISGDYTFKTLSPAVTANNILYPIETTLTSMDSLVFPDQNVFTLESLGVQITRVNSSYVNVYPKTAAWSLDEKYLRLERNKILDAQTFAEILTFPYAEARWAKQEDAVLLGIRRRSAPAEFGRYDVATRTDTKIYTFDSAYGSVFLGPFEGHIDNNDDKVVLVGQKDSNGFYAILFSIKQRTVLKSKYFNIPFNQLDYMAISPSGNHVIMNLNSISGLPDFGGALQLFDLNFNRVRTLALNGEHGDFAYDQQGNEVFVQFSFESGNRGIFSYFLDREGSRRELNDTYGGGHISGQNFKRPGYVYVSTNGTGYKQIYALKLDGQQKIELFSTHQKSNSSYGVPNHDGSKVMFKSLCRPGSTSICSFISEAIK